MKPRIAKHYRLQWEPVSDCHVLLYPEGLVELSESAAEILKLCDGVHTPEEIVNILQEQFASPEIKADVMTFLREANEHGWVQSS